MLIFKLFFKKRNT